MKKIITSILLFPIFFFASNLSAQNYAILKPTTPGVKSDVIPISKKQLKELLARKQIPQNRTAFDFQTGIIDTISHNITPTVNFGIMTGDTLSSYYEPPANCFIRAIGIVGQKWSSETIADGFHLMIHKREHPWEFPTDKWLGDACYTKDSLGYGTMLGEKMWGAASVPIVDRERVWTEMDTDVDTYDEGFVVSIVPFGGEYMGTDAVSFNNANDIPRFAKYCQSGRAGHEPQWVVRNYSCTWLILVEFIGQPPTPMLTPEIYGTVLDNDAKPLKCHICDFDEHSPDLAGIYTAKLYYKINDGDYNTLNMYLISGTDVDGTWEAVLPAGFMNPGDVLTYKFVAIDKTGLIGESVPLSFRCFNKTSYLLVFFNDNLTTYPFWNIFPQYDNLWYRYERPIFYDVWIGNADGPLTEELLRQYEYLVQIDGYSPATMNDDVVGAWFESGPKYMFWSSQEWAGILCGGWEIENDTTFAPDDWHNKYLGIEYIGGAGHDIATDPFPINPVPGDTISGNLSYFIGDSLQLFLNYYDRLGWSNWSDALIESEDAVFCFYDSAMGRTMGIHKEYHGSKTVFLTFDQLCLEAQPGNYWTEPNINSLVDNAIEWFIVASPLKKVSIHELKYFQLNQNYPNPFNAETIIRYTLSEPADVQLSIYNITGQQIAELVNEKQPANSYAVNWDAGDFPSGVYFCRINAGDFSKSIKMMLIR